MGAIIRVKSLTIILIVLFLTSIVVLVTSCSGNQHHNSPALQNSSIPAPSSGVAEESHEGEKPKLLHISSISLNASFVSLGPRDDGSLDTPPLENTKEVGWYHDSALPGENGNTIILGHSYNFEGPSVFAKLTALHLGDVIEITNYSGKKMSFVVSKTKEFNKVGLPLDEVFRPVTKSELTLVTCAGLITSDERFTDNFIVQAQKIE